MDTLHNLAEALRYVGFCAAHPKHPAVAKLRRSIKRAARLPNHAGLIDQRKCRSTGALVGLYDSAEAGMEMDPETPWSTVCETHGAIVCHSTLANARAFLPHPEDWCDECRDSKR